MPTITTVDATWDTGVTLDAAELRRADSAMFLGDGTSNGVRGGIVYHGPGSLAVSVNGSDQVTVQPGAFVIPAATGLGVYRASLATATAATALTARNATNPRIDLIVIQATGTNATVKTIDGTPGASPSAPALPAQHIELARLTVPAVGGGAVIVDSSWRAYAAALGGTIYVPTAARLPGSGMLMGQRAVALDTGAEHTWTGSSWQAGMVAMSPALGYIAGPNNVAARRSGVASLWVDVTRDATSGTGAAGTPIAYAPGGYKPIPGSPNAYFVGADSASGSPVVLFVASDGAIAPAVGLPAGSGTLGFVTYVIGA